MKEQNNTPAFTDTVTKRRTGESPETKFKLQTIMCPEAAPFSVHTKAHRGITQAFCLSFSLTTPGLLPHLSDPSWDRHF
jgi:hypothetical protein